MKVAVSRHPDVPANAHFGYAASFDLYDISLDPPQLVGSRPNLPHCADDGGDHGLLDAAVDLLSDCVAVFADRIGPCGRDALLERRIIAVEHAGPGLAGAEAELDTVRTYLNSTLIAEARR